MRHRPARRTEDHEPEWKHWWRRGFAATLILALVVGLFVSFRPSGFEDATTLAGEDEPSEAPERDAAEADENGGGDTPPSEGASEAPGDDELSREERQALIDEARAPEETTVQVLDAGGGSTATDDVAEVLGDMGYDVVAINPSRLGSEVTTVLYTEGNNAEADALRARDDRFSEVERNDRLSEGVDLHVLVAPDWED